MLIQNGANSLIDALMVGVVEQDVSAFSEKWQHGLKSLRTASWMCIASMKTKPRGRLSLATASGAALGSVTFDQSISAMQFLQRNTKPVSVRVKSDKFTDPVSSIAFVMMRAEPPS